ncbi:MAG: glycosyltransferase family 39 protein [Anaerolineales bacterium]|nr:MAG: glycosyltransferase family 39 protein [Anaerolineales bacterium]
MQWLDKYKKWLLLGGMVLLFLAVRVPGLGRFVTIDEVYWLTKSAQLAVAVAERDWDATDLSSHPGMTTAWAGALALELRTPELNTEPPEHVSDFHLRHYFRQQGYNPAEILSTARLVMVALSAVVFAGIVVYAYRLWGAMPAALVGGLLAFDPYLIAHQRLLHQDGLMALLCVLSLLAFAAYLRERSWAHLLVSGAAAGLAWATKSPMLLLGPWVAVMAAVAVRGQMKSQAALRMLGSLAAWGLVGGLVFTLLWPKMWVAPVEAITQVLSYAGESAGGVHSGTIFFAGQLYEDGKLGAASAIFYPVSFVWRATPVVLLGLAAAGWVGLRRKAFERSRLDGIVALLGFAILFVVMMSLGDKKFDRYMLPSYAILVTVAGWGLALGLQLAAGRWPVLRAAGASALAATLLLSAQLGSAVSVFPYYLSYYNPLVGGTRRADNVMMLGWGEGLEQAANWLAQQPGIGQARVASWYSNAFMLSFPYDVTDIPLALSLPEPQLQDLLAHDYLVIYVHQWQRHMPQDLLDALADQQPVHVVVVDGIEYVRVYQVNREQ